jgi:hypothetical protein
MTLPAVWKHQTSGGGIDIEIKELGKYVKVSNSGGHIDLQLPKDKGVDLDLSGGKIKTDQLGILMERSKMISWKEK